jgi:hypothetical protein
LKGTQLAKLIAWTSVLRRFANDRESTLFPLRDHTDQPRQFRSTSAVGARLEMADMRSKRRE